MIDFKTLKFMKLLDQLAVLTANGIRPFSDADDDTKDDFLFYDEPVGLGYHYKETEQLQTLGVVHVGGDLCAGLAYGLAE